jgi:hypothetical protein
MALGAYLQFANWNFNRSYWADELDVALNLRDRGYAQLARPLDWDQVAPIGFLWAEKTVAKVFGDAERPLRLIPLLAALASMPLIWFWMKGWMPPTGRSLALGLMILQPRWVQYGAELKPYSIDLAATLLVLLFDQLAAAKQFRGRRFFIYAVAGITLPWFSFPIVFVLAGASIAEAIGGRPRPKVVIVWIFWAISAALQFKLLHSDLSKTYFQQFWAEHLFPWHHGIKAEITWLLRVLPRLYRDPFDGTIGRLAALLAVLGILILLENRARAGPAILGTFLAALFAAIVHVFPIGDRLGVYLIPLLAVCPAMFLATAGKYRPPATAIIAALFAANLLFSPARRSLDNLLHPLDRENSRPVIQQLAAKISPAETIYVYHDSRPAFLFYAPRFGINTIPVMGNSDEPGDDSTLRDLLAHQNVWVFFAHVPLNTPYDMRDHIQRYCAGLANPIDAIRASGCAAILYSPKNPPVGPQN